MGATVLEKKSFDEKIIKNGETALVDLYADWCMPCKILGPVLDAIAEEFSGKVNCYKVNVDGAPEIAAKYKVMSIPTVLLFTGGELIDSFTGSIPKDQIKDFLDKNLGESIHGE